jgi:hypothetical protein
LKAKGGRVVMANANGDVDGLEGETWTLMVTWVDVDD